MIPLRGRAETSNWATPSKDVWRVATTSEDPHAGVAVKLSQTPLESAAPRAGLYLSESPDIVGPGPTIHLPVALGHVEANDVVIVSDDGSKVMIAWKNTATHNSVLLTERCDNYCIMCSQPPKDRLDSHLYLRAERLVSALPSSAQSIAFTGGEPTVEPAAFLHLLEHCAQERSDLGVHVLSNGRKFADRHFAEAYAAIPLKDVMVGIPLYSAEPGLHDFVVQARGAFNETVKGVLNLAANGARIEIRVVVQHYTVSALVEIAQFIARNLPFVEQVAFMGLEMTGLARPNSSIVWADPADYRKELRHAYELLSTAGIYTRIYNHQLCVIDREVWPGAVRSISDWKNDYPALCDPCIVRDACGGVFTTSGARLSEHLRPIT